MNWIERSLDELGEVNRGRSRHRPRDAAHLYGGPHPFVQTGDVKRADLYLTEYSQTYSDAGLAQSKLWKIGTLCITIAANIADTAILGIDACFPDSVIGFIADEKKADARFIKYMFDARLKHRYRTFSQGVAQDNLSQEKLLSIRFQVPEKVYDQKMIADILVAYDALIANNARRIALLETSARLLFEEWFVRLRYPSHERNNMVNGVPDGWERSPLETALILQRGFDLPNQSRREGSIPIYGSTGLSGYHNEAKVSGPGVVTGRSGTLGEVHYVRENFWPLNTALWVKEFRRVSPLYALFLLRTLDLKAFNGGVAVPTLDRKSAHRITILVPPRDLIVKFDEIVASSFSQIGNLDIQNQLLRRGRDLLLPRLMDGRIEV